MAGWLGLMVVMAVSGRQATRELDVFQIMEVRSLIGMLLLAPLVYAAGGLRAMRTTRPLLHVARNVVHYGAQYAWLYALTLIPLAQLVALEFTMPIWTLLLAAAFLGEPLHRWKAAAVALGLAGVVLIVQPTQAGVSPGQLIALAAAVGFAVSVILVKLLTHSEDATRIMFWMLVVQSVLGLWPALATWRWPSPVVWGSAARDCARSVMLAYLPLFAVLAVVGAGLVSGLLFAFSNFVMQALLELPAEYGQQAMQRINVRIINPVFLLAFMGSALACALVAVLCVLHPATPGTGWLLAGALTYLAGPFGVTLACNVPLNNAMARARPDEASTAWPANASRWRRWNHLRTVLAVLATTLLGIGLLRMGVVPA